MTRAEERGLEALPPRWRKTKDGKGKVDSVLPVRKLYIKAYEQAEKDLALSLAQVVKLDNIIMNMVGEGYNDGYKTRPFYEEVLKRFNEQRNGRSNLQEMP